MHVYMYTLHIIMAMKYTVKSVSSAWPKQYMCINGSGFYIFDLPATPFFKHLTVLSPSDCRPLQLAVQVSTNQGVLVG